MVRRRTSRDEERRWRDVLATSIGVALLLLVMAVAVLVRLASRDHAPRWARKEIAELCSALETYFRTHGAHPPDTRPWNEAEYDPRSLHRYLGREVVDPETGRVLPPFLGIRPDRLIDRDADGVGVYVDGWGNPYHFDAMHMKKTAGTWQRLGEPYLAGRKDEEKVLGYKLVSFGPDGESAPYPFDREGPDPRAADDVRSW